MVHIIVSNGREPPRRDSRAPARQVPTNSW